MRIGLDVADIDAFGDEGFAQETAHMLVADARQHGDAQAEPRSANRRIGRRAAEIFGEARHVLEPAADLLAVEIDCGAPHRNQIERRVQRRRPFFSPGRAARRWPSATTMDCARQMGATSERNGR